MWDEYVDKEKIEIPLKSNYKPIITPTNSLRHNEYENTELIPKLAENTNKQVDLIVSDKDITIVFTVHYALHRFWLRLTIYDDEEYAEVTDKSILEEIKPIIINKIHTYINELNSANVKFIKFISEDGTVDEAVQIFNGFIFGAFYYLPTKEYLQLPKIEETSIVFEDVDDNDISNKIDNYIRK